MLEKLTPEQEARLPQIRDEWLAIGCSTEPCDFEAAKEAACRAYKEAGLAAPTRFYHARGPLEAAEMAVDLTNTEPLSETDRKDELSQALRGMTFGSHDAAWLSLYSAFAEFGLEAAKRLEPLMDLAKVCGWWAPYKDFVIFQDRHSVLRRDERHLLHCEDGPAVAYRDGFTLYFWHGVNVPSHWIMEKNALNPADILKETNVEKRRAGCEIIGWGRILEILGATLIDENENPQIGTLYEADLPDSGKERFLQVKCGTGRDFVIPVPPETQTALDAQRWMWNDDDYNPEVRS